MDPIAQAAGRCNSNGRLVIGRTVVFKLMDAKPPRSLEAFWQAAEPVLRAGTDPISLEAIYAYFANFIGRRDRRRWTLC